MRKKQSSLYHATTRSVWMQQRFFHAVRRYPARR
jgi:hypothetical protein